jgi:hypothetical protein
MHGQEFLSLLEIPGVAGPHARVFQKFGRMIPHTVLCRAGYLTGELLFWHAISVRGTVCTCSTCRGYFKNSASGSFTGWLRLI